MAKKKGQIYVGTSGFSYPHWRGKFYPEKLPTKSWLSFYSEHFFTVELNSPFYRLPERKTFVGWRKKTPKPFIFSVKMNRFVTHVKRLEDVKEPIDRFFDAVEGLAEKLGPILFQLPPKFNLDLQLLEKLFTFLPSNKRYTFEFRHESWFNKETYRILEKQGAALCYSSTPRYPTFFLDSTPFIYARFHGKEKLYSSCYSLEELKEWAEKFQKFLEEGKDVYVYFDNDVEGYAIQNARELLEFLGK